jgi:MFS family permease
MRLIMAMSFVQLGVVNWAWYAWQPYVVDLAESDSVWFVGVIAALLSVALMAGNALVGWLSRRCGRRTTLLVLAAVGAATGSVLVGVATTVWAAVAAFLLFGLSLGVTQPVKQAYVHGIVPSSVRASVVSFDSMIGNAGGVGGQLGLGALSRSASIGSAYVASGAALVVLVPIALVLRARKDRADLIVGETAGARSACAAQGLPDVLGVDADVLSPTVRP